MLICLSKLFWCNQNLSKTNSLMVFHLCSAAEWGQRVGKSQVLWFITDLSLKQMPEVLECVCVFESVRCLHWDCRSRGCFPLPLMIFSYLCLTFFLPSVWLSVCWGQQPVAHWAPCWSLSQDILLHFVGLGGRSKPFRSTGLHGGTKRKAERWFCYLLETANEVVLMRFQIFFSPHRQLVQYKTKINWTINNWVPKFKLMLAFLWSMQAKMTQQGWNASLHPHQYLDKMHHCKL